MLSAAARHVLIVLMVQPVRAAACPAVFDFRPLR
jgi:hypothetical protein